MPLDEEDEEDQEAVVTDSDDPYGIDEEDEDGEERFDEVEHEKRETLKAYAHGKPFTMGKFPDIDMVVKCDLLGLPERDGGYWQQTTDWTRYMLILRLEKKRKKSKDRAELLAALAGRQLNL